MRRLLGAAAVYSAGRLGLFVVFALLIWSVAGLLGYDVNGFPLLLAALLLSSAAGWFLLVRPRERLALALADRRDRAEAARAAADAELDRQHDAS